MAYIPQFTITPVLLSEVEQVAALRERIQSAGWILPGFPPSRKTPGYSKFLTSNVISIMRINTNIVGWMHG